MFPQDLHCIIFKYISYAINTHMLSHFFPQALDSAMLRFYKEIIIRGCTSGSHSGHEDQFLLYYVL